jgi:Asp/Glu/hydantoin racemase
MHRMRPQLLIINPNTSVEVSHLLHTLAVRELGAQCDVRVQTARFGASYISDEVSFAIAGHALLDAYAADKANSDLAPPDAVLIGCFGDPGLLALQQISTVPVIGLAQGSMRMAHANGRFAVITGGQAWVPMLHRLVTQLGLNDQLAVIEAVNKSGAQLAADPVAASQELADLGVSILAQEPRLQTLLLGGAALGGLAQPIQALLHERGFMHVQVMDSVTSSLHYAATHAINKAAERLSQKEDPTRASSTGTAPAWVCTHLSPELSALLGSPPHTST